MEHIFLTIKNNLMINNFMEFFSIQILCIIGIILNISFYLFSKKRFQIRKISNITTLSVLGINALFFLYCTLNTNETIFLLADNLCFSKANLISIFILNLFLFLFDLTYLKILKRTHDRTSMVSAYLLGISFFSNFICILNNPFFAFICLDIVTFLIYGYAYQMKAKKNRLYDAFFVAITFLSSGLFYIFYLLNLMVKDDIISDIVQICLIVSFFAKIGVFPIYNYFQGKSYKKNLPYCTLLLSYLPCLGVIYLSNFTMFLRLNDEIFQLVIGCFLLTCCIFYSLNAFKTSNMLKMFSNIYYYFITVAIINILLFSIDRTSINLSFYSLFAILGIYSLITVLKLNSNNGAINAGLFKGINKYNPFFAFIFTILTLEFIGIIPNSISIYGIKVLKNIYIFDKMQIVYIFILLASYIILVFAVLKTVQNIYLKKNIENKIYLTKRTTLNYVVPIAIILFLIINLFL